MYFNNNENDQITGTVKATYSDIQNGYAGEGNIRYNPVFKSPQELIIVNGSPCVDAGNPDPPYNDVYFPPSLGTLRNDMGAHGGPTPSDFFYTNAIITVLFPNGGEIWKMGVSDTIQWSAPSVSGNVKIDIYTKRIGSWSNINGDAQNTGSYLWIPDWTYISDSCLMKISSISNPAIFDQSDSNFCIGMKGDVNFDGCINELDIWEIAEIILNGGNAPPCQFWTADCVEDDSINTLDIQWVVNYILKHIITMVITPNGGETWIVGDSETIT